MFARKIWQPLGKLALSRAIIESNRPSKFAIHGLACSTEAPYMAPSRGGVRPDRKRTRLNSSHSQISYAAFCFKKKTHRQSLHPKLRRYVINLSMVVTSKNVGIKYVSDKIWLLSFMEYDLGFFDHATSRLASIE